MNSMRKIYDLNFDELVEYLESIGEKKFRAKQIYAWLYKKRVSSFDEMTDIKKELIAKLKEEFVIDILAEETRQVSHDGTIKFLFKMTDGSLVESVLMVFDYGYSACISTQVGCNMGCTFCASGLLKKVRNLSSGEIFGQLLKIQMHLDKTGDRLGNIVVMGTGEPFDNYDNTMKALAMANDPNALEIGARHISISTSGLIPSINRFSKEQVQYNLAISLHAPNDELRSRLMPVNKAFPLKDLMAALKDYSELNNRRLTFEYLLLDGVNNSEENADELKQLLKGMNAYVNLIPYNSVDENDYRGVSDKKALMFYDMLKKRGISVTLRQKKGDDIDAACGQLRAKHSKG